MLQMGQYYVTGFESFYTYSKKNTFPSFVGLKKIGTFSCSSNCTSYILFEKSMKMKFKKYMVVQAAKLVKLYLN